MEVDGLRVEVSQSTPAAHLSIPQWAWKPERRGPDWNLCVWTLSGLAEVLDWSEAGVVGRVEVNLEGGQERLGRVDQTLEVVPPAVTGELVLHLAPEPLDQSEVGGGGWQKEGR